VDAESIARMVSNAVGDGCVVCLLAGDEMTTAAVDHRDPARRALMPVADGGPSALSRGWLRALVETGRPLRTAASGRGGGELAAVGGAALPWSAEGGSALAVPLRSDGAVAGVVVALRDRGGPRYSLREQALLEGLVGRATRQAPAAPGLTADELATLLHARSDAAVWATDLHGRTLAATPALGELLGLPAHELVGLPMTDFVEAPPASLTGVVPEEPERGDRRVLRSDGRRLWVATSSLPLIDATGRRRGLLTTVTDVTERKRIEVEQRLRLDATTRLLQLVGAVLRGEDPSELRDCAVQAAAEVFSAWRVGIFELRRDGALMLCAGHGWRADDVGSRRAVTLGSPAGLALTCEEPVVVRDAASWPGPLGSLEQDGVGSGCWVGFGGGRGLIAVLEREPRAFAAGELDFLVALAEGLSAGAAGARHARPAEGAESAEVAGQAR
jgi:PAS domain S-box-containing protein